MANPQFSPLDLLRLSTDGPIAAADYMAAEAAMPAWRARHGAALLAAATPATQPGRGGADPVAKLTADIVDLFADHGCVTNQYLHMLGWTAAELAQHGEAARAAAAGRLRDTAPTVTKRPRQRVPARRRAAMEAA